MKKIIIRRDVMESLVKWTESSVALLLRGPRQVGKTFILKQLGEERGRVLFVNLRDVSVARWFEDYDTRLGSITWDKVFSDYAAGLGQDFTNERDTLVILDEIQLSRRLFNSVRDMVRDCLFRIAMTGSYLGIMDLRNRYSELKDGYFYSAGDTRTVDMYPLTYREVLTAAKEHGRSVEETGKYYLRFGGFPDVVKRWLYDGEVNSANLFAVLEHIYATLVDESRMYFADDFSEIVWTYTLAGVVAQISKRIDVAPPSPQITYRFRTTPGLDVSKAEVTDSIRWMQACHLLFLGCITNNLKTLERVKFSNWFTDQGLMMLVMTKAINRKITDIQRGQMAGLLAENFVALVIDEFACPVSYVKKTPPAEIDFVFREPKGITAIEVKFSGGDTSASDKAMKSGSIVRMIKVVGKLEDTDEKENVTIIPIWEIYRLNELLGEQPGSHRYNIVYDDFGFDAESKKDTNE